MLQSTGWTKGLGYNQQGTASPMEVSLPFPSLQNESLLFKLVMWPERAGGSSQLQQESGCVTQHPLDAVICALISFAGREGLRVCWREKRFRILMDLEGFKTV